MILMWYIELIFFSFNETPNEGGGDQNVLFIRILNDSKNSKPRISDFFYISHQLQPDHLSNNNQTRKCLKCSLSTKLKVHIQPSESREFSGDNAQWHIARLQMPIVFNRCFTTSKSRINDRINRFFFNLSRNNCKSNKLQN